MSSQARYRNTLRGVTPSPAWRKNTLEAMKAAQGKRVRLRRPLTYAAAAAVLLLGVAGGIWWSGRMETDPNGPGVAQTPEPAVTPTPSPVPTSAPNDPIWNDTFSIVTDPSQLMGSNPTAGRLDELTQLPVYENPIPTEEGQRTVLNYWAAELNLTISDTWWTASFGEDTMGREPSLEADCTDGTHLCLKGLNTLTISQSPDLSAVEEAVTAVLIYNSMTMEEMLSSVWMGPEVRQEDFGWYDFTGALQTVQAAFLYEPDATAAEQLYAYSFQRVERTDNQSLTVYLPPTTNSVSYPLRSPDDAAASFRSGDYWGSDYTAYPGEAEILQVTLEYDIGSGQPYLQPVYRILFTQDYWDEVIPSLLQNDGLDASVFTGVGVAYVPAIEPDYQDEVPYRRYFNDGLAHFTPEDFP